MGRPARLIGQLWNFSVCGSNRTSVFGFDDDSVYQTMLPTEVMPYGPESGPLGDGHSFTAPVFGSRRPIYPRGKSVYQIASSGVIVRRRGRESAFGSLCSVTTIVVGSTLPM